MSLSGIDTHVLKPTAGLLSPALPSTPTLSLPSPSRGPVAGTFSLPAVIKPYLGGTDASRSDEYLKQKARDLKADDFIICSFSSGQTLEDHMTMSTYRFRPYELLEVS